MLRIDVINKNGGYPIETKEITGNLTSLHIKDIGQDVFYKKSSINTIDLTFFGKTYKLTIDNSNIKIPYKDHVIDFMIFPIKDKL